MGIVELPSATARQLGASLDIADPLALAKELLENSIDAEATHISILISPNTVDTIQVRDNGLGIPSADFDALGRRSHTSKLETIDDLQQHGIKTLGFRGQALASANSVASITITTRARGDPVASQLRLKPGVGGVEGRRPASAPVGTTVRAEALFETIPIRKRYAVRESQKTLSKIKELLGAYALARPHLKLSLKILGDLRNGWDYAPSRTPMLQDAVLQIFGRELLNQYSYAEMKWENGIGDEAAIAQNVVTRMQAILPTPGFNSTQTKAKGRFFSINSRPIAASRGLSSRLLSALRTFLSKAFEGDATSGCVSIPFVQLDIQCVPESYDVNVAPLKDELLFAEEDKVVKCFEDLCRAVYQQPTQEGHKPDEKMSHQDNCSIIRPGGVDKQPTPDSSPLRKGTGLRLNIGTNTPGESTQFEEHAPFKEIINSSQVDNKTHQPKACTQMRTAFGVNLSRTQSDATDEISSGDEVTVEIPSRPMLPNRCVSTKGKPKNSTLFSSRACFKEDIHRYFKPTNQLDFEIATDDTATDADQPGTLISSKPDYLDSIKNHRQPLQPVREARLNVLNNENEDSRSFHRLNQVQSSPELGNTTGQITPPRPHMVPAQHISREETMLHRYPPRDAQATLPPVPHLSARTPLRRIQNVMETPPPSIDFTNVFTGERIRGHDHSSSPRQGRGLVPRVRSSRRTTRGAILSSDETQLATASEGDRLDEGSDMSRPRMTLPPLPRFSDHSPEQRVRHTDDLHVHDDSVLPSPPYRPSIFPALHRHGSVEDSLVVSKSTRPGYVAEESFDSITKSERQPRRINSSISNNLPLERIPHGYETYSLLSVIEVSASFKSSLAEPKFLFGELNFQPLEIKNTQQSLSIEKRLMTVVDIWKADNVGDIEIEYTLRSHAKGKGTM